MLEDFKGWSAAVRTHDGDVTVHDTHYDAWMEYYDMIGVESDDAIERIANDDHDAPWEAGFVDPTGTFFTREEALVKWKQLHPDIVKNVGRREWGASEDILGFQPS